MANVQEVWNKLNPRERLTAIGALVVVVAWLVGAAARGFGVGSLGLIGAIAVLVVLYLKYAPNTNISWPIAVPLITLGISAIIALFAVLTLIEYLGFLNVLGPVAVIGLALYVIGALVMAWGSWQEYQIEKPAIPNLNVASTGTTPADSATPGAAPAASAPVEPAAPAQPAAPAAPPPAAEPIEPAPGEGEPRPPA